jgi:ubiquinone biosynthesis monooxygenase Coq6
MEVWDGLTDSRISFAAPFLSNSISSSPSSGDSWEASFASALKPQRGSMSTMVENLNLQRAALRRIEELKGKGARVELVEGKKVSAIEEGEGGWPIVKLEGEEARSLRARLLVRWFFSQLPLFCLFSASTDRC